MNGSTLLQLFKTLDRADRRQLRKIVRSPYFNAKDDVTRLFDYIDKNLETGGAAKMTKEKAYAFVYPKQAFDVDAFYYPMSFLTQIILKYLAINELENDTPQYHRLLNQALRHRGADKIYEKTLADAKSHLDRQPHRNARYHFDNFQVHFEEFDARQGLHRDADFGLQGMTNDFHFYCISEILRLAYALLSHQNISKKTYEQPLLDPVLTVAERYLHVPAVAIHYYAFKTLKDSTNRQLAETRNDDVDTEGVYFQKLKTEITENQKLFTAAELRDLLYVAINYSIRRQNQGELAYVREALDLYQIGFDNRILMENGVISPYTYNNAQLLAIKIKDFDWAEKFLNDYKPFLPEKERDNIYKYNLAIFHFRKNDYTTAMQLLQEVNLKEVLFNLDARRLLARIYFETNEMNALDSHIESSKIYLHRQKDVGYHKEAYSNFFKFMEKLVRKNWISKEDFKAEISQTSLLVEKDWLMNQI